MGLALKNIVRGNVMKDKSNFRKKYIRRLILRIIIFVIMICLYIYYPNTYEVSKGINFIKMFSPLHIIWLLWMIDMILQLCIVPKYWPLGSQKFFAHRYLPSLKRIDIKTIKEHIHKMNKDSIAIAITWLFVIALIGVLYFYGKTSKNWYK